MMELSGIQGRETIMAIVYLMTHLAARLGGGNHLERRGKGYRGINGTYLRLGSRW